ncbi:hypothetical protein HIM_09756 [Hirsutella minnesotensis 3608]|uniref:Transcription factor domain-containing protein n=1 Tax=Hirsutella minnesotensis 3608 TaxID=1043627 RepID=A0A0F7ZXJ7_9HYPO|nr:hypothetical protein HIM_09756 [Hirsutella minnesotensis 3608]
MDRRLRELSFAHDMEACQIAVQMLKDRNHLCNDVEKGRNAHSPIIGAPAETIHSAVGPAVCSTCFCRLRPWNISDHMFDLRRTTKASITLSMHGLPTPVSLPPYAKGALETSHTNDWTYTDLTKSDVRMMIDALRTWDYLPFCLICEELFFESFDAGFGQFSSKALVDSLLALAIRVLIEDGNDAMNLAVDCPGSRSFSNSVESALGASERLVTLPDIQALGILALYQLTCGNESGALSRAQSCMRSISDLCVEQASRDSDEMYTRSRTTTYCAAMSLVR